MAQRLREAEWCYCTVYVCMCGQVLCDYVMCDLCSLYVSSILFDGDRACPCGSSYPSKRAASGHPSQRLAIVFIFINEGGMTKLLCLVYLSQGISLAVIPLNTSVYVPLERVVSPASGTAFCTISGWPCPSSSYCDRQVWYRFTLDVIIQGKPSPCLRYYEMELEPVVNELISEGTETSIIVRVASSDCYVYLVLRRDKYTTSCHRIIIRSQVYQKIVLYHHLPTHRAWMTQPPPAHHLSWLDVYIIDCWT